MIQIDLSGKTALITGGTAGIGLASALELAKAGAQTVLSYKWGSADMEAIAAQFQSAGAAEPVFVQADVSQDEDTALVLDKIAEISDGLDIYISNVGFALKAQDLSDYKKRSLYKTFDYSSWPLIDYVKQAKKRFGRYPGNILAISSDGPDHYYQGYDFVAASKSLLEFFSRYLAVYVGREGGTVNAIRFGTVRTPSFEAIFGADYFSWLEKAKGIGPADILTAEQCGKTVLALCSGLMGAVNGQIISADKGMPFIDNSMMDYHRQMNG